MSGRMMAVPVVLAGVVQQHRDDVGLTDHEVWDVVEIAAMYNFTNRMALATGQQPNEEYHSLDRG